MSAANVVGWAVVVGVTAAVASGVLANGFVTLADRAFSVANTTTPDGVVQPLAATRSGSPTSSVRWETLGREGRVFVAGGPSTADIAGFTGSPAVEPVRAYAGLEDELLGRYRIGP